MRAHPALGARLAELDERIRRLLAGSTDDRALIRAAAARGALRHPFLVLPDVDVSALRDELVAEAARILKLDEQPRGRTA